MATYVLVGGAWLGGWAWRDVARRLRAAGHEAYPVTQTGLGEREHLARPDIDLETFVKDVVKVIEYEDLRDVVLVGHSFGGIVASGVADRVPDRIATVAFLDSAPVEDGEAWIDFQPPEVQATLSQDVADRGDGWRLSVPPLAAYGASTRGLDEARIAEVSKRMVPQPFATWTDALPLTGRGASHRLVAIACDDLRNMLAAGIPRMVEMTREPWEWVELDTGHWPMFSAPGELAEVLGGLAC
jgi:pimeloyl-ACP methyl ester carboxylesterase